MCCLNVIRVIVSPCPAHSFRILMVRNNVVVVSKLFMADCANARLLSNLAIQQFAYLGRGSKFTISTRMMRVRDPLHAHSYSLWSDFLSYCFSTAAKQGSMYGTIFIATQPHGTTPDKKMVRVIAECVGEIGPTDSFGRRPATIPAPGRIKESQCRT